MSIHLYQIQYDDQTQPSDESGFIGFDVRDNPEFLKREMAHMIRFYDQIVSKGVDGDFYGLFSPKFSEKSGLLSSDVLDFVAQNTDADLCIFNPFPINVYKYLNVWRQGEERHPNLIRLANQMFEAAKFNFDASGFYRNSVKDTVYCNYWVAKKNFFDDFIHFVRKMDQVIENMPEYMRSEYFSDAKYVSQACYYPFLFERLLSSFLVSDLGADYISKPYIYQKKINNINLAKLEKIFIHNGGFEKFYQWEEKNKSLSDINQKIEVLENFLHPKINQNLFFFAAKLLRSIIKRANRLRIYFFLKENFD